MLFRLSFILYLVTLSLIGAYSWFFLDYTQEDLIFRLIGVVQILFIIWLIFHYLRVDEHARHIMQYGREKAIRAAIIGWSILFFIEMARLDFKIVWSDFQFSILLFIIGLVITVVAGFVGGHILAYLEYLNSYEGSSTRIWSVTKGIILGALAGIAISLFVIRFVRGFDNVLFLIRMLLATIIAAIAGGFVGNSIFYYIDLDRKAA